MALAYFKWMPFPWRQPLIAAFAIALVLAAREPLASMGFCWPIPLRRTLLWALAATLFICAFVTPFIEPWLNHLTGTAADYSGYGALQNNLPMSLRLIAYAWISAAIGEEIIFRGYFLHQVEAVLGNGTLTRVAATVLGATVFGLSHHTQGMVGMLLTGLTGLLMGAVFYLSGRNLWTVILAHALIDAWGIATLYFGWY